MAGDKPHKNKKPRWFFGMLTYDPNAVIGTGYTRLQNSVLLSDMTAIYRLVRDGADINFTGTSGAEETPLALALRRGAWDCVEALVELGADLNIQYKGYSYASIAVLKGRPDLVDLMVRHGAKVHERDKWSRQTPLFYLKEHDSDFVPDLLESGVELDAQNHEGYTALYHALCEQRYNVFSTLLKNGANPNLGPEGYQSIAEYLLENADSKHSVHWRKLKEVARAKGDMNVWTTEGESFLMKAIRFEDFDAVMEATVRCKKDMRLKTNDNGDTPLHIALQTGSPRLVNKILDQYQECPRDKNAQGMNVMQMVLSTDYYVRSTRPEILDMMRGLFEKGFDVNAQLPTGETLLHCAVEHGNEDLLDIILDFEPNLDVLDQHGHTPLTLAVENNNVELLDALLDAGADPDVENKKGWTLLDRLARDGDRTSPLVQRLIAAGASYKKQLPSNDHRMSKKTRATQQRPRREHIKRIDKNPQDPFKKSGKG